MATFDSTASESQVEQRQQFPFRRVELTINKFIKILQIDLDRLHRHKINILRLHAISDWKALDKEQVNAYRTVQQIKGTIRQLEQTRTQVFPEDLPKFDSKLRDMHQRAITSINDFLNTHIPADNEMDDSGNESSASVISSSVQDIDPRHTRAEWKSTRGLSESYVEPASLLRDMEKSQEQLVLHPSDIPDAHAEQSWRELKESLDDLNGLMRDFSTVVHAQQETVDRIEDNIETAQTNVRTGVGHLATAAKLKTGLFPVAGALIGGALGGPVGLVAGMKLGGLAAVSGGIIGFTGGRFIRKKANEATDTEMQNLSKRDSKSLSDLANEDESR